MSSMNYSPDLTDGRRKSGMKLISKPGGDYRPWIGLRSNFPIFLGRSTVSKENRTPPIPSRDSIDVSGQTAIPIEYGRVSIH